MMTWESFYFCCFLIGFFFSLLSFLAGFGFLHIPHHFHLHAGHPAGRGGSSPVNFGTVAAFLAWFGGAGYILSRYSSIWTLLALLFALLSGLGGAAAVFWFLVKVLLAHEEPLDPADYDLIGVLGRVSSTVHSGGVGEMIFSQTGSRRAASIRSENGAAISKGVEVVVTRYEAGIAYVRPWDELTEVSSRSSADQ
jgi:membrane protein implicated in regulation of membrane protease activity